MFNYRHHHWKNQQKFARLLRQPRTRKGKRNINHCQNQKKFLNQEKNQKPNHFLNYRQKWDKNWKILDCNLIQSLERILLTLLLRILMMENLLMNSRNGGSRSCHCTMGTLLKKGGSSNQISIHSIMTFPCMVKILEKFWRPILRALSCGACEWKKACVRRFEKFEMVKKLMF